jgi:hypothetical protein
MDRAAQYARHRTPQPHRGVPSESRGADPQQKKTLRQQQRTAEAAIVRARQPEDFGPWLHRRDERVPPRSNASRRSFNSAKARTGRPWRGRPVAGSRPKTCSHGCEILMRARFHHACLGPGSILELVEAQPVAKLVVADIRHASAHSSQRTKKCRDIAAWLIAFQEKLDGEWRD